MLAISEVRKRVVYKVHNAISKGYDTRNKYPVRHGTSDSGPRLHHESSGCEEEKSCRQADNQDLKTKNSFYTTCKPQYEISSKNTNRALKHGGRGTSL